MFCPSLFGTDVGFFSSFSPFSSPLRHFLNRMFKNGLTHLEPSTWWLEIIYHIRADTIYKYLFSAVALINGLSNRAAGGGLWWCSPSPRPPWASGAGTSALLGGLGTPSGQQYLLINCHQNTSNEDVQSLVNQLFSNILGNEILPLLQLLCGGKHWISLLGWLLTPTANTRARSCLRFCIVTP